MIDSGSRPNYVLRRAELEVLDKRLVGSCHSHKGRIGDWRKMIGF
jgi:hypothetical protein